MCYSDNRRSDICQFKMSDLCLTQTKVNLKKEQTQPNYSLLKPATQTGVVFYTPNIFFKLNYIAVIDCVTGF